MTQMREVRGVKTSIRNEDGFTCINYRGTDVVRFNHCKVILNTGGWRTNTTKTRMNQAAAQFGLGYHVAQKHGEWCVHRNGTQFRFDGEKIILDRPES